MNELTENLPLYEQTCSRCVDDLYYTAYIVLADADTAEELVTEICVAGVHKYENLEDEAEIRFRLTFDLYRCMKRKLSIHTPDTNALPTPLQRLSAKERLILAMRFSSGLSVSESRRILGLPQEEYQRRVNEIMKNQ